MAQDMFLDLGKDIKGEAVDADAALANTIQILSFSWGETNHGTFHAGGGGGGGKSDLQDITFSKYMDKATCPIVAACVRGDHIPKAVLYVRKAGGKPLTYLKFTLTDVLVSNYNTGGNKDGDRVKESFSLNFGKLAVEYMIQKKDGTGEAAGNFTYDIAAGTT
jgi:type VI secretion system secreted protein Hcp